jgi:hypothetical protein
MSPGLIANAYAVGSALLALWIACRYPQARARTPQGAFALAGCAYLLLLLTGRATAGAESLAGPAVALLVVVLPLFTFAFWAGICLLRATLVQNRP